MNFGRHSAQNYRTIKFNKFRKLGIMAWQQEIRTYGLQANVHATSRLEGTFELGIMDMIPNH